MESRNVCKFEVQYIEILSIVRSEAKNDKKKKCPDFTIGHLLRF